MLGLDKKDVIIKEVGNNNGVAKLTSNSSTSDAGVLPVDFTYAAELGTPAVVHIKSTVVSNEQPYHRKDPWREFFGDEYFPREQRGPRKSQSSGSGVIINDEGYIVTNNHVVAGATELEVTTHDNQKFKAKVIGTDPTTDLAVIQIKGGESLPHLVFGNSDEVKVGEWVLAVGNPFNLSSTVTAGIVSAKGRNIHILKENYAIESFIQTDAAVNPGNSGGALTNLRGELIGINTAIATPTGTYAGYSFAVPSSIVKKVAEDLIMHGAVQRGVLGVMIHDFDGNQAKELELDITEGVYIDSVMIGSAAEEAGLEKGDIVTKVDGNRVKTSSNLQEIIGTHRPGESVSLELIRNGKEESIEVILKNRNGKREIVKKASKSALDVLGIELKELSDKELKKYQVDNGVQISKLEKGKLRSETDVKEGFIITKIDGKKIKSIDGVKDILDGKSGGVMMEGVYPDYPGNFYYAFGMP